MDDQDKLHHIFGNPDHNLDALVSLYGNEKAAGLAILEAVTKRTVRALLAWTHVVGISRSSRLEAVQ